MLKWAVTFFVVALVVGILGFVALAGVAAGIAQVLFFVLVAVTVVSFLLSFEQKSSI